ncbi:hypothetical protein ABFA07_019856 [Porites harrisoni]
MATGKRSQVARKKRITKICLEQKMFMSGSNIREAADLKNVIATGKRSQVTRVWQIVRCMFMSGSNNREAAVLKDFMTTGKRSLVIRSSRSCCMPQTKWIKSSRFRISRLSSVL